MVKLLILSLHVPHTLPARSARLDKVKGATLQDRAERRVGRWVQPMGTNLVEDDAIGRLSEDHGMRLDQHFELSGQWLFRWRSYLPFIFLVPLGVAVHRSGHDGTHLWADTIWPLICVATSMAGLALRLHCVGHAAPRTSGAIRTNRLRIR